MTFGDRFERQRILPEIGESGQARLETSELVLWSELDPVVLAAACLYGEAVGLRVRTACSSPAGVTQPALPFPLEALFRHSAPRQLACGAHLALTKACEVLDIAPPKS